MNDGTGDFEQEQERRRQMGPVTPRPAWSMAWVLAELSERFGNGRPLARLQYLWYWLITVGIAKFLRVVDLGSADLDSEPRSPTGQRVIFVAVLIIGGAIIGALGACSTISARLQTDAQRGWSWGGDGKEADFRIAIITSIMREMLIGGLFLNVGLELAWVFYREMR